LTMLDGSVENRLTPIVQRSAPMTPHGLALL
jgi:hypothetical protein